jgi:genome maintenance exonuclease 1
MMEDKDLLEYENIGRKIKKSDKYAYADASRIEDQGTRLYDVNGARLPSVTTILGKTKNQQFLKDWKAKVGEQEAERIKNVSSSRGTSMHKFLENYITGVGYDDLTALGQEAKAMAQKVIDVGLTPVEEYYGSEVTLYYPGLYAGSTDLVCLHNNLETVVDFKQANRPKKKEWIEHNSR